MTDAEERAAAISAFVRLCTPTTIAGDEVVFADSEAVRQQSNRAMRRVYGGVTMVQALVAAARSSPLPPHSLHTTFLRPGDAAQPIAYRVERLRDGRTFTTRHVRAHQGERILADITVSFTAPRPGPAFQAPMPEMPGPDEGGDTIGSGPLQPPGRLGVGRVVHRTRAEEGAAPGLAFWLRPARPLPDDPLLRAAYLLYESDNPAVIAGHYDLTARGSASLDHQVWWHSLPPAGAWVLFVRDSPVGGDGRALLLGAMYTADGVRRMSTAQEFFLPDAPAD